jgi:hypothetical protein
LTQSDKPPSYLPGQAGIGERGGGTIRLVLVGNTRQMFSYYMKLSFGRPLENPKTIDQIKRDQAMERF